VYTLKLLRIEVRADFLSFRVLWPKVNGYFMDFAFDILKAGFDQFIPYSFILAMAFPNLALASLTSTFPTYMAR
jgi:hypothetical protein